LFLTSAKNKERFVLADFACFCAAVHRNRRIQRIKRANDEYAKTNLLQDETKIQPEKPFVKRETQKNNNSARRPACVHSTTAAAELRVAAADVILNGVN